MQARRDGCNDSNPNYQVQDPKGDGTTRGILKEFLRQKSIQRELSAE